MRNRRSSLIAGTLRKKETMTDAVLSMFTQSDFGRQGGTNVEGPILKLDYMLFPRLTLTTKGYFVNFIDRPKGLTNSMVSRLQFDAILTF